MILFGVTLGVIGFFLDTLFWLIVGGILLLVGIFLLVSFRHRAPRRFFTDIPRDFE
jgi:hypothetical protein